MTDKSNTKDGSIFLDASTSKFGTLRKSAIKKNLEPKQKTPGYVDGECYRYKGRNMDSFCRQAKGTLFVPEIEMFTLRNPRLQYLFNSEIDELKKSFLDLQKQTDERTYKYEVMIAFWLAIDLGKDQEARTMISIDPLVE